MSPLQLDEPDARTDLPSPSRKLREARPVGGTTHDRKAAERDEDAHAQSSGGLPAAQLQGEWINTSAVVSVRLPDQVAEDVRIRADRLRVNVGDLHAAALMRYMALADAQLVRDVETVQTAKALSRVNRRRARA